MLSPSEFLKFISVFEGAQGVNICRKNASSLSIVAILMSFVSLVGCTKKNGDVSLSAQASATNSQPEEKDSPLEKIKYYEDVMTEAFKTLSDTKEKKINGFVYSIVKKTDGVLWYLSIDHLKPPVNSHEKSNARSPLSATFYFEKPGQDHPPSIAVHWKDLERDDINFYPDSDRLMMKGGAQAKETAELIQKIADELQIPVFDRIAGALKILLTIQPPVDLKGADCECKDFRKADLQWANFEGANLLSARFQGANLKGANFKGANLRRASFEGANLKGANFKGANLQETKLQGASFIDANFQNADLQRANLKDANLVGAFLQGANLKLAQFKRADFNGANLEGAMIQHSVPWAFKGFRNANLKGADLQGANFSAANLEGANLEGANLEGANLEYAILRGASLINANLKNAKLKGAFLKEAKMTPCRGVIP